MNSFLYALLALILGLRAPNTTSSNTNDRSTTISARPGGSSSGGSQTGIIGIIGEDGTDPDDDNG